MPDNMHVFFVDLGGEREDADASLRKLAHMSQREFIQAMCDMYDDIGKSATRRARRLYDRDPDSEEMGHYIRLAFRCSVLSDALKRLFLEDSPVQLDLSPDAFKHVLKTFGNMSSPKNAHLAHPSVTRKRVLRAVMRSMHGHPMGFCLGCGTVAHGVPSDAKELKCPSCGARQVHSAEQILEMGAMHVDK
jgi:rubrerythrin